MEPIRSASSFLLDMLQPGKERVPSSPYGVNGGPGVDSKKELARVVDVRLVVIDESPRPAKLNRRRDTRTSAYRDVMHGLATSASTPGELGGYNARETDASTCVIEKIPLVPNIVAGRQENGLIDTVVDSHVDAAAECQGHGTASCDISYGTDCGVSSHNCYVQSALGAETDRIDALEVPQEKVRRLLRIAVGLVRVAATVDGRRAWLWPSCGTRCRGATSGRA